MNNGLYKVTFRTPLGSGAGVIVLNEGRLLGGDSMISYVGNYVQSGDKFTATIETTTHTAAPGMRSVLGVPDALILLAGSASGDSATMQATSPNAPNIKFQATLTFLTA